MNRGYLKSSMFLIFLSFTDLISEIGWLYVIVSVFLALGEGQHFQQHFLLRLTDSVPLRVYRVRVRYHLQSLDRWLWWEGVSRLLLRFLRVLSFRCSRLLTALKKLGYLRGCLLVGTVEPPINGQNIFPRPFSGQILTKKSPKGGHSIRGHLHLADKNFCTEWSKTYFFPFN